MDKLVEWKNSTDRKPLILKGARQVGKTYSLKEFAKNNYENFAYFTFDRNEIDFVIQNKNKIIPIEVKSNKITNHNSLTKYNDRNNNEISFSFSFNNLTKNGKVINIPLYFIEYINNLDL